MCVKCDTLQAFLGQLSLNLGSQGPTRKENGSGGEEAGQRVLEVCEESEGPATLYALT